MNFYKSVPTGYLTRSFARGLRLYLIVLVLSGFLAVFTAEPVTYAAEVKVLTGDINGAAYHIEVPPNWNGTLLLWSHGTAPDAGPNPAAWQPTPEVGAYLLSQGFALAGSSFKTTGWAVADSLEDNPALIGYFKANVGTPKRIIAWGASQGGIHTGALIQRYPNLLDGAVAFCGVMMGGRTYYNANMDMGYAFKTLLAPDSNLQVVNITDAKSNVDLALQVLDKAKDTPEGKARIALAASLRNINDWYDPSLPQPAKTDIEARYNNMFLWMKNLTLSSNFGNRLAIEKKAGGNFSSNAGIDYKQLFANVLERDVVEAIYKQAGLNLNADLDKLNNAPRINPDPAAYQYMANNIEYNGKISIPLLTVHTTGDGYVVPQGETSYAELVRNAGNGALLNQTYINRAGHCSFTPAEYLTGLFNLISRLDTGQWKDIQDVGRLNNEALALGPELNIRTVSGKAVATPPAFVNFSPGPYPRTLVERALLAPAPVASLPNTGPETGVVEITFPQTGYNLSGKLLNFWNQNGGLPVFGYPIDSERRVNGQVFQWFERNRLELHPENSAPYNVELGLLGVENLARRGIDWQNLPKVAAAPLTGCRFFAETGHSLCADFLNYWEANGLELDTLSGSGKGFSKSLALFGYPISEPELETNSSGDTVLTQWFERARMEIHPENPGQYRVLLGRLGNEMLNSFP